MPEPPKRAYMVAATFGKPPAGVLMLNALIAISPEAAAAIAATMFGRLTDMELQGINIQELTEGFMVEALAAVRGQSQGGPVLSLVRQPSATDLAVSEEPLPGV